MNVNEIEEELSVSRYDLQRAEDELDEATKAVASLTEEVESTRSHIQRLQRQRQRAIANAR